MARPAPAVERTVALLEFLAVHPNEAFSLSELARRLDINKATGHAMVAALTDAGYLLRHPVDKTYSLGPALIAIGNAAGARQFEVVDYARREMDQLARELRVQCVASAEMGDEIVLLARSGETEPLSLSVPVGQRLPLVPPLGTVFLAWESPDAIDRWLRRLGPRSGNAALARYREAVATVRRRGYSIGLEPAPAPGPRASRGRRMLRDAAVEVVEDHPHDEYILLELENAASYRLSHIAAPVFGADGRVALALTLMGFRHQLSADQVPEHAARLRQATLAVTRSIHGRLPNEATG
ncbi:MAG: transcriptional regulator, IclR family [Acidimicrobiales bacterium]|jgi:DNA-binding IclR family transcriptional regulator|nr:transcriptional regulator, IclR family [Acidimicrobiales bacterium]